MEENRQHFGILCFIISRKVKNATEMQKKKDCAVCGEGAVTHQTCQKWFAKFHAADFQLGNALSLGGPVEVDRNQIKTLIENNHCSTMWEIADILKISKSIKITGENEKYIFYFMEKNIQQTF